MLVPIEWLKDYTNVNVDIDEFCDRMIMSGSNLETATHMCEDIKGVVVGKIMEKKDHPDSDHLSICMTDVGTGRLLQIVCGAPNVREGICVPVALPGAFLPGALHGHDKSEAGVTIEEGEVKGVKSEAVICSHNELGFEPKIIPVRDSEGIWILPEEECGLKPGDDLVEAMGLASDVIDFEITPNRPDCLCMIGMARESAATFEDELRYPETETKNEGEGKCTDYINISISNSDFCKRFYGRVVTDIKIEQSPWWMQKRLMYAGMRPINNIVDLTNFVMLEYGQPLHAYDIRTIKGGKIDVDTVPAGTKFTTLDGNERSLVENSLMIKDAEEGIGLAGIMGGLDSEIQDDTTTIVIEGANFDGDNIRLTSKALGLRTEASSRFEKGIDPNQAKDAVDRVCYLIEQLGCGKVVSEPIDVYPNPVAPWDVKVRVSRVNKIIGVDIPAQQMLDIFADLEIKAEMQDEDTIIATPPTVRLDLKEEIDFVEEVARIYGYDNLPLTLPAGVANAGEPRAETVRGMVRDTLSAMGVTEIITYSFTSPTDVDRMRLPEDAWERNFVELMNPLGEDSSVMRTILLPQMMQTLGLNFARSNQRVRFYEMGVVFAPNELEPAAAPVESENLCIGIYGDLVDFFVIKGMVETMLDKLGITGVRFTAESGHPSFHPGRCATMAVETKKGTVELGVIGEVHPDICEDYGVGMRVYASELFFDKIVDMAHTEISYEPLPIYPAIGRDIAITVDEETLAGDIELAIEEAAGDILESVKLFDVYRGEQVEKGSKSLAFSMTYRSAEKTLTDEEVDAVHEKVVLELKSRFNAALREL